MFIGLLVHYSIRDYVGLYKCDVCGKTSAEPIDIQLHICVDSEFAWNIDWLVILLHANERSDFAVVDECALHTLYSAYSMILKSWSILTDGAIINKPELSIYVVKFAVKFAWVAVSIWLATSVNFSHQDNAWFAWRLNWWNAWSFVMYYFCKDGCLVKRMCTLLKQWKWNGYTMLNLMVDIT